MKQKQKLLCYSIWLLILASSIESRAANFSACSKQNQQDFQLIGKPELSRASFPVQDQGNSKEPICHSSFREFLRTRLQQSYLQTAELSECYALLTGPLDISQPERYAHCPESVRERISRAQKLIPFLRAATVLLASKGSELNQLRFQEIQQEKPARVQFSSEVLAEPLTEQELDIANSWYREFVSNHQSEYLSSARMATCKHEETEVLQGVCVRQRAFRSNHFIRDFAVQKNIFFRSAIQGIVRLAPELIFARHSTLASQDLRVAAEEFSKSLDHVMKRAHDPKISIEDLVSEFPQDAEEYLIQHPQCCAEFESIVKNSILRQTSRPLMMGGLYFVGGAGCFLTAGPLFCSILFAAGGAFEIKGTQREFSDKRANALHDATSKYGDPSQVHQLRRTKIQNQAFSLVMMIAGVSGIKVALKTAGGAVPVSAAVEELPTVYMARPAIKGDFFPSSKIKVGDHLWTAGLGKELHYEELLSQAKLLRSVPAVGSAERKLAVASQFIEIPIRMTPVELQSAKEQFSKLRFKNAFYSNCAMMNSCAINAAAPGLVPYPFNTSPTLMMAWLAAAKLAGNRRIGEIQFIGHTSLARFMRSRVVVIDVVGTIVLRGVPVVTAGTFTMLGSKALGLGQLAEEMYSKSSLELGKILITRSLRHGPGAVDIQFFEK